MWVFKWSVLLYILEMGEILKGGASTLKGSNLYFVVAEVKCDGI